jgi:protein O-mannosyl-transferase
MRSFLGRILLRPSIWVAIITMISYWDWKSLNGKWVYDDAGSVAKNIVVVGQVPWYDAFTRDFWGTSMKEVTSHKSFRPITTLSFKLNYLFNEHVLGRDPLHTFSYRLVNLILHVIVSALVTESSAFIFRGPDDANTIAQIITGLLFGLHPVHAEAVSNVTSRGEMWMSLFFLMAFLSYASSLRQQNRNTISSFMGVYIIPFLGMTLSLFSKEQGATTLISLVIYDFIFHHGSLLEFYEQLFIQRQASAISFVRRTLVLAFQTIGMAYFRYLLNGETSPDFIFDQNPAGFSKDRFTRVFSTNWVYCLYIRDMLYPAYLCPDWSGRSIKLISTPDDERIWFVILLWIFAATCFYSLFVSLPQTVSKVIHDARCVILVAFWAFMVSPFILSSNLLIVVGLMKADRVIYLPLLGFCFMEALIFKIIFTKLANSDRKCTLSSRSQWFLTYSSFMCHAFLLTAKLHERNVAWSDSLNLWLHAYAINPISHHTMYNCGYELSTKQRFEEAEFVMREIGNPRVDGPSNTFVYAMVLFNLRQCDYANELIDDAIEVLNENRATGGPRNLPHMLDRTESNLLVARAHCIDDIRLRGHTLYQAVQKDPTNTYAVEQAQNMMEIMKKLGVLND